jgi:hypothetical protein
MKCQEILVYKSNQNLQRKFAKESKYFFGKHKYRMHWEMDSLSKQNGEKKQGSEFARH